MKLTVVRGVTLMTEFRARSASRGKNLLAETFCFCSFRALLFDAQPWPGLLAVVARGEKSKLSYTEHRERLKITENTFVFIWVFGASAANPAKRCFSVYSSISRCFLCLAFDVLC